MFFRGNVCFVPASSRFVRGSIRAVQVNCIVLSKGLYFLVAGHPLVGLVLLSKVPRSYSDTPHSVGLLRTSDQSVTETSA